MPALKHHLAGKVFGFWTVVKLAETPKGHPHRFWFCQCKCGQSRTVAQQRLLNGRSKSCGCGENKRSTSHGLSHSRVYNSWVCMKTRCQSPTRHNANLYYEAGITFCKRWESFANFYADMGEPPSPNHTLDRIKSTKGYSKANCRWATPREQAANKKSNRRIRFNGRTMILCDWARELGIGISTLSNRLNRCGWSVKKAFTTPV